MNYFSSVTTGREYGFQSKQEALGAVHFPQTLARRLGLEKVLEGHYLCVNRLAWNAEGSRLMSGSDDRRVLIWHFPDYRALPLSVNTHHDSNIFGVQFMPCTGDRMIVTGAMDRTVQLHRLDVDPGGKLTYPTKASTTNGATSERSSRQDRLQSINVNPTTTVYSCHTSRVKAVEVEPLNAHNFWSSSEDGTIRQFDLRCRDQGEYASQNVLISVRAETGTGDVELKGLDMNNVRPHYMAVACGDPYVRVYDRRKLSLGAASETYPEPVLKLAPPHITLSPGRHSHTTYVNFSNGGDKIVASYHGDHAYAFDVTGEGAATSMYVRPKPSSSCVNGSRGNIYTNGFRNGSEAECSVGPSAGASSSAYCSKAQQAVDKARAAFGMGYFHQAIEYYTQALSLAPQSTELYLERCRSFLQRGLIGDAGFALRDADQAIALDEGIEEAYFLRLRALDSLGQRQMATSLYHAYIARFPFMKDVSHVRSFGKKLLENQGQGSRDAKRKRRSRTRNDGQSTSQEREGGQANTDQRAAPSRSYNREDFLVGDNAGTSDASDDDVDESSSDMGGEDSPSQLECMKYYGRECGEEGSSQDGPRGAWWGLEGGRRFLSRFIGHCNVQTDIKEAIFVGQNDGLVACGSDDGKVFIYNADTGEPIQLLDADEDVANCVQCHPSVPVLATSGIESVVRLWSPCGDVHVAEEMEDLIAKNQERMKAGPRSFFAPVNEQTLMQMQLILDNYELVQFLTGSRGRRDRSDDDDDDNGDEDEDNEGGRRNVNCRMA